MSLGGGGGGSQGSGGQGGTYDWPQYMKDYHIRMLGDVRALIGSTKAPTTYLYDPKVWFGIPVAGTSPYVALAAFNALSPTVLFQDMVGDGPYSYILGNDAVADIKAKAETLRALLVDPAGSEATLEAMVDAHAAKVLQKVDSDILPRVEVGMRDANAVIGTSFVIAKEIAMEDYSHEVADFSAKARMRLWEMRQELYKFIETAWVQAAVSAAELAMKHAAMRIEFGKFRVALTSELANTATLAQSKYGVVQTEAETRTKLWKLDLFDHMCKVMASISGASPVRSGQNHGASVFSGTLGMGAMGAGVGAYLGSGTSVMGLAGAGGVAGGELGMAGGPAGALVGGIIGAGLGLMQGLFSR